MSAQGSLIAGQHSDFDVDGIQHRLGGRDLIVLGGDLPLGRNHAVVVAVGSRTPSCRPPRRRAAQASAAARTVVAVVFLPGDMSRWPCPARRCRDAGADGGCVRRRPDAGELVGPEAEHSQDGLRARAGYRRPRKPGIGHRTDESSHARPANRNDRDFAMDLPLQPPDLCPLLHEHRLPACS